MAAERVPVHAGTAADEPHARLLDPELRNGYFETENRPKRDGSWGLVFAVCNVLSLVGGIGAAVFRDPEFVKHVSAEYLSEATHCSAGRDLLADDDTEEVSAAAVGLALSGGVLGSIAMGFLYTLLLKKKAIAAVVAAILCPVAYFFTMGGFMIADSENATSGWIFVAFGFLFVFLIFRRWDRLQLVARLITVSSEGVCANPGLTIASLGIGLVSAVVAVVQIVFLAAAGTNGSVVANTMEDSTAPCTWQPSSFAVLYIIFGVIMLSWNSAVGQQANVYTVAAAISQWYFNAGDQGNRGTTLRAISYALGPSFGSLCLSGAVLALINFARSIINGLRRRFGLCCSWILQMLLSWMSLFTKFTTIRMAMTGESFFESAGGIRDLLRRNMRDTYTVWWLPPFVLRTFALLTAIAWGLIVGLLSATSMPSGVATGVGILSGYLSLLVLMFVASLALSATDTIFICWVMDCDRKQVTRVEVHEVFAVVPLAKPAGLAVEQPDGTFAYAPGSTPPATGTPLQEGPYHPPAPIEGHTYPAGYSAVPESAPSAPSNV